MIETEKQFTNDPVMPGDLPTLEGVTFQGLSANYFWSKLIGTLIWLTWITLAYFILAFALRDEIPLMIRTLAPWMFGFWWIFSLIRVYKTYQKKAYALRQKDIHFKSGWIWKRQTTIPYNRIQHCELSSGPIDRLLDLTALHIYTAGGSNSDLSIPGMETQIGKQVKKMILNKIASDEEE
jgi:membrane protein YdbS with pleckstrin-like domain